MTTILAIETATEACSAALLHNDHLIERYQIAPRKHTQLILPMVKSLMDEADIQLSQVDAIAFGRGPGAFTGLRIASGVTQGLALAHEIPVIPISTLAAMAYSASQDYPTVESCLIAIDARINEVYWGEYRKKDSKTIPQLIGQEKVCKVSELSLNSTENWVGVGTGWDAYHNDFKALIDIDSGEIIVDAFPRASAIAKLAEFDYNNGMSLSPEQGQPIYLRDKVAETLQERALKNA